MNTNEVRAEELLPGQLFLNSAGDLCQVLPDDRWAWIESRVAYKNLTTKRERYLLWFDKIDAYPFQMRYRRRGRFSWPQFKGLTLRYRLRCHLILNH